MIPSCSWNIIIEKIFQKSWVTNCANDIIFKTIATFLYLKKQNILSFCVYIVGLYINIALKCGARKGIHVS